MADNEVYNPPAELVANSNIKKFMDKHGIKTYDELLKRAENQEWYWGEVAKELEWFKPFTKVLDDSKAPFFKWYRGRQDQHHLQLPGPAHEDRGPRTRSPSSTSPSPRPRRSSAGPTRCSTRRPAGSPTP